MKQKARDWEEDVQKIASNREYNWDTGRKIYAKIIECLKQYKTPKVSKSFCPNIKQPVQIETEVSDLQEEE